MSQHNLDNIQDNDPTSDQRKADHITLAFQSQTPISQMDDRFYYEPMLSGHPKDKSKLRCDFIGQAMNLPLWVSSMTGGTTKASIINKNLGKATGEYGLGMGLGSCRGLLFSDEYLSDFKIRKLVGDQPLYANLGIAQVEELVLQNKTNLITELIKKLEANGLIIHVNPLQEWLQPEGDRYHISPIDTIGRLCDKISINIIVKEVGQGFGVESLKALFALPIKAIDFAAHGGTNFSTIELGRANKEQQVIYNPLTQIGHTANSMVDMVNSLPNNHDQEVIISGGIKNYLDGYYLIQKCKSKAIYGQASQFLKYAMEDYETLQSYIEGQIDGLSMAFSFLTVKR